MSWLVKGYGGKVKNTREEETKIYTETAQYLPDITQCIRDAVSIGSTEIIIVKCGERGKNGYRQPDAGNL